MGARLLLIDVKMHEEQREKEAIFVQIFAREKHDPFRWSRDFRKRNQFPVIQQRNGAADTVIKIRSLGQGEHVKKAL